MKKKIGITISIIFVILCFVLIIYLFPIIKVVQMFWNVSDTLQFHYQSSFDLKEEDLSEEQRNFINVLSSLLEVEKESCLLWNAEGMVYDNTGYVKLYCEAFENPITELYLTKEEQIINVGMFYRTIQSSIAENYMLLSKLLPDWNGAEFISLEQIEEIFDVDLKDFLELENIEDWTMDRSWNSLLCLNKMKKSFGEQSEVIFETQLEEGKVEFKFQKEEEVPTIEISILDSEEMENVVRSESSIVFDVVSSVDVPTTLISSKNIEILHLLWSIFTTFSDKY